MRTDWIKCRVTSGKGLGKTIGYPTLNLDPVLTNRLSAGVYTAKVKIEKTEYPGVLYFGPRHVLGETDKTLEIFVIGFNGSVYGSYVHFQVGSFIRPPKKLPDFHSLKRQLAKDVLAAKKYFRILSKANSL